MELQSGHLSDAQIEQYGTTAALPEPDANDRDHAIEAHLADCSACRERMLAFERVRLALLADFTMSSGPNARRPGSPGPNVGPDCASEDDLRDLAAGVYPEDKALAVLQHASLCPRCGRILREYSEDFSDDFTDADKQVLAKLKSGSPDWQKKLMDGLLTATEKSAKPLKPKALPWRWIMAPVALAGCATIGFVVWNQQRDTPEKAEKLLARAYADQRTIEMRIPGGEWGQVQVTRGSETPTKPEALLEAQLIIARNQAADPNNGEWLRSKGEAELLDGQPDQALATLTRALEIQPDSVTLMEDISIADLQVAQRSHDASRYSKAIDLLTTVAAREPQNKEALFNLALAYTRGEEWDRAITSWEAYLKLDPHGPWADEAMQRLNEIKRQRTGFLLPTLPTQRAYASD